MTNSRAWFLALLLALAGGSAGAQTAPKDLPWAVAEFEGSGEWRSRLPLLLVRGWESLPAHRVTDAELTVLKDKAAAAALRSLQQQASKLRLDLDTKALIGTYATGEPAASLKALAALEAQVKSASSAKSTLEVAATLALRATWASGRDKIPWSVTGAEALAAVSQAIYVVTGTFRTVGGYLTVSVSLDSAWEGKTLAQWSGQFAPDEAPLKMAEAADALREALLGRPWAGVKAASSVPGSRVKVDGVWRLLPWSSDDLEPGPLLVTVDEPGRPAQTVNVDLLSGQRTTLSWNSAPAAPQPLVLETDPPGALLYLDSRYLGPSPQTIERPLEVTRVRAQADGWANGAWEVGPSTASPSRFALTPPTAKAPVLAAKDHFYWALASFSAALTTAAFAGAWSSEQVKIVNGYADAGDYNGYTTALGRYQAVTAGYGTSIVLTSGLFVWMMFELGNYLGAAQASLP